MTILQSAAQVLRCFSEDCPEVSVTELVHRLGMPKSNASRLLRAMRDAGLLETVGASKRYRPALMLLDVARTYHRSSTLLTRADAVVAAVSGQCGHTGYVSKLFASDVTAVTDHPGTNALRVVSSIGRRLPAFASATGRSLLARLPDDAIRAMYAKRLPPAPSRNAPQTMTELLARVADIRRTGISVSDDEANRGVAAVAVAVGEPDGGDAVSLCIVFPLSTCDRAERKRIAEALHSGAADIAHALLDPLFAPRTVRSNAKAA